LLSRTCNRVSYEDELPCDVEVHDQHHGSPPSGVTGMVASGCLRHG
jgi:hypothetical protein